MLANHLCPIEGHRPHILFVIFGTKLATAMLLKLYLLIWDIVI